MRYGSCLRSIIEVQPGLEECWATRAAPSLATSLGGTSVPSSSFRQCTPLPMVATWGRPSARRILQDLQGRYVQPIQLLIRKNLVEML
jgi:hypothetical protein